MTDSARSSWKENKAFLYRFESACTCIAAPNTNASNMNILYTFRIITIFVRLKTHSTSLCSHVATPNMSKKKKKKKT